MNKLCVFSTNVKTYFMTRLINEVGQGLVIFNPQIESELPDAQAVLVRTSGVLRNDLDLAVLEKSHQTKIYNPLFSLKIFRGKASQYEFFEKNNFPHLPWKRMNGLFEIPVWGSKYLVKPDRGQGGWGIRVFDRKELLTWWSKQKVSGDLDYLLQPFMTDVQEFRVFFCGLGRIILKRKNSDRIPANFQSGGEAELSSLPSGFSSEIERLIKCSGAVYGAIDLFIKADQMFILELNTVPGIEQLEMVSGTNIIRSLLGELVN
jgi:glutathione synthase/RimK-type ligase-like ATP-grasp enzyme